MSINNSIKENDPQMVEFYHDRGWMPDWAYYQLNGKSAQENYATQRRNIQAHDNLNDYFEANIYQALEKVLYDIIIKQI